MSNNNSNSNARPTLQQQLIAGIDQQTVIARSSHEQLVAGIDQLTVTARPSHQQPVAGIDQIAVEAVEVRGTSSMAQIEFNSLDSSSSSTDSNINNSINDSNSSIGGGVAVNVSEALKEFVVLNDGFNDEVNTVLSSGLSSRVIDEEIDEVKGNLRKIKTPMCLINELARFNKIRHQYILLDEQGPAHRKTFYVKLRLGDEEEFLSEGQSIKKAQHAAATIAIKNTKYPSPPQKTPSSAEGCTTGSSSTHSVPPTVELNALAMKLCYTVVYMPINSTNYSTPSSPVRTQYRPTGASYGFIPYPGCQYSGKSSTRTPGGDCGFRTGVAGDGSRFSAGVPRSDGRFCAGVPGDGDRFIRGSGVYAGFIDADSLAGYNRPHSASHRYGSGGNPSRLCRVSVKIGDKEYVGEGLNMQAARHCAAANALAVLRSADSAIDQSGGSSEARVQRQGKVGLEVKDRINQCKVELKAMENIGQEQEKNEQEMKSRVTGVEAGTATKYTGIGVSRPVYSNVSSGMEKLNCNKSEISLVHEIALRHNLSVMFEVIKEAGPPHLRTFVTRCVCVGVANSKQLSQLTSEDVASSKQPSQLTSEGVGSSKQLSKRRAAECMLQQLQQLSPPPTSSPSLVGTGPGLTSAKLKKLSRYKHNKGKSIVKVSAADYGAGVNPVSRLAQVQQIKKEREPLYELMEERGLPRCREFIVKVSVGDHSCVASGTCKKVAKRNAAEEMLQLLGYSKPVTAQPIKSALRASSESINGAAGDRRVKFSEKPREESSEAVAARLLVPGVILRSTEQNFGDSSVDDVNMAAMSDESHVEYSSSDSRACVIITELRNNGGISPTLEAMMRAEQKLACGEAVCDESEAAREQILFRPKDKLLFLASVLGFHVQFTDFPKGNKSHYLSIATLSTNPPQHSHGSAPTIDAANDSAALLALKNLAEFGLDGCATPTCCHSTNSHQ